MTNYRKFWLLLGLTVTALIVFGQIWRLPSAVWDVTQQRFPMDLRLSYSTAYVFLSPLLQIADHLAMLSIRQHVAFFIFALALWGVYRWFVGAKSALQEIVLLAIFLAGYATAGFAIAIVPYPMARLEALDPHLMLVDFHSHTHHSWDARKNFSVEKNLAWHERAGFHPRIM